MGKWRYKLRCILEEADIIMMLIENYVSFLRVD